MVLNRRRFLQSLGVGISARGLPCAILSAADETRRKPLSGIFPIMQTPFTENNQLDLDALAAEVKFLDRARVQGMAWPQMASEWSTLTEKERFAGMEAIVAAGKDVRPAIVLGVQSPDTATATRFAKHAEKRGADAVIALPPSEPTLRFQPREAGVRLTSKGSCPRWTNRAMPTSRTRPGWAWTWIGSTWIRTGYKAVGPT